MWRLEIIIQVEIRAKTGEAYGEEAERRAKEEDLKTWRRRVAVLGLTDRRVAIFSEYSL